MLCSDIDNLGEILTDSRSGEPVAQVDTRTTGGKSIAQFAPRTIGGAGAERVPIR